MRPLVWLVLAPAARAHWWNGETWLWVNHRGPFVDLTLAAEDSFIGHRAAVEGTWGLNHLMEPGHSKEFIGHFFKRPTHPLTLVGTDDGVYWWSVVGTCGNLGKSQEGVMSVYRCKRRVASNERTNSHHVPRGSPAPRRHSAQLPAQRLQRRGRRGERGRRRRQSDRL